ncbi:1,4-alpha-glucan branching protein [Streptomyces sp. NPDC059740]|uniref:maltokinase N-terminal cap-like domain-containing protein n=1 Tax=Streptomyces sp. NPDC059740 TaxID=3346926 RepID=UPI0036488A5A
MAVVHRTTLSPTKLELLAGWLPTRPWYVGGRAPRLERTGGFRLDDPAGEVGIEIMAATDSAGPEPVTYHVPLAYRGAPLPGAEDALLGTMEHGVLGRRWAYDGSRDPVVVAQLTALLHGAAEPQAQSVSNTPDPAVEVLTSLAGPVDAAGPTAVKDTAHGTELAVTGATGSPLTLHLLRVLRPGGDAPAPGGLGRVVADWTPAEGEKARGTWMVALDAAR